MEAFIDALIQAGGVAAVAGIFLWYMDREGKRQDEKDKRNNTLIGNHLDHSTQALEKMSNALTKLTVTIDGFNRQLKNNRRKGGET